MTYSPEWGTAFINGQRRQRGITERLAITFQNFIGPMDGQRVLEMGCGCGMNAPWIIASGAEYRGIDGNAQEIEAAKSTVEGGVFACADFTQNQPFLGEFDIVFERASIAHNDLASMRRAIDLAWEALRPGGLFISSDWFSINHSEAGRGDIVDAAEPTTRTNYPDGQFRNIGRVHFSSEAELADLFSRFQRCWMEERITRRPKYGLFRQVAEDLPWVSPYYLEREYVSAVWDFMVRKPR